MAKKINRSEKAQAYTKMLNTKRWRVLRRWKLDKNPLCELCEAEGKVASAIDVHHITPVESGARFDASGVLHTDEMERLCFDESNLIAVCIPHHIYLHRKLRSHKGQIARTLPKEQEREAAAEKHVEAFARKHGDTHYEPKQRPRIGIRKTRYGWLTLDEYRAEKQKEIDARLESIEQHSKGKQNLRNANKS